MILNLVVRVKQDHSQNYLLNKKRSDMELDGMLLF